MCVVCHLEETSLPTGVLLHIFLILALDLHDDIEKMWEEYTGAIDMHEIFTSVHSYNV